MDIRAWINGAAQDEEERLLLKKTLELHDRMWERWTPVSTRFLSERERALCKGLVQALGNPPHGFWGGYPEAERTVLTLRPEEDAALPALAVVEARFFADDTLSHRDILGALMGLGIDRALTGDILVAPGRAQVCVLPEIVPFLRENWRTAGRSALRVAVSPEGVTLPPPERELRRGTVSSLRLDAVLTAVFRLNRALAAGLVRQGRASVNHTACTDPDRQLSEGDVLTLAGHGKARLAAVGGRTKKDRIAIEWLLYV